MSAASRRFYTPEDENAALCAAAWSLEKTNPLWKPAKENKGFASRRQSIFGRTHQRHKLLCCLAGNLAERTQLQLKLQKNVATAGFTK